MLTSVNFTTANCVKVNLLTNQTEQCWFTHLVDDCEVDGFIGYTQLAYCNLQSPILTTFILILLVLVLFVALGTNADDFLCPLLITISKSLKISDNIAGVTFLAFGNGAPDIFSAILGISGEDPNLVIGQLYGAGIFVTTVVVGTILIQNRFQIMHRPLMRDISFYLVTTSLVWATFLTEEMNLYHSLLFITIYLVYVSVVIVSGIIYKRQNRPKLNVFSESAKMPRDKLNRATKYKIEPSGSSKSMKGYFKKDKNDNYEGVVLRRIKFRQYCPNPLDQRRFTLYNIEPVQAEVARRASSVYTLDVVDSKSIHPTPPQSSTIIDCRRPTLSDTGFYIANDKQENHKFSFRELLDSFAKSVRQMFRIESHDLPPVTVEKATNAGPVKHRMWKVLINNLCQVSRFDAKLFPEMTPAGKLSTLLKAPIYVIYTLTIPVVDQELPLNGWQRNLNRLHLLLTPQICVLITRTTTSMELLTRVQLHFILLLVSLALVALVTLTSSADKPPRYHVLFAYFGFAVAIGWIYTIANEVINILDTIRILFSLSKFIIGLTVLAWGNSVGDFISNMSMAKNGFPRMAISACFGGPVLNMLLGIGIPYTVLLASRQASLSASIKLEYSKMISILYGSITISLLATISTLLFLTHFSSTKAHGFLLYALYVAFLLAAINTEFNLI